MAKERKTPAQKKWGRVISKMVTIYPEDVAVAALGGWSSPTMNAAIECWSKMIQMAALDNERQFSKEEWRHLTVALEGAQIPSTSHPQPGTLLAHLIRSTSVLTDYTDTDTELLAKKCEALDFVHAWAVLFSIMFYFNRKPPQDEPWYTVTWRTKLLMQQRAKEKGTGKQ